MSAQEELIDDLLVGQSPGQQLQHLRLSGAEALATACRLAAQPSKAR
ncbi:MAG: hypothetical protein M3O70_06255 [Actinomycetota bacterium]|nr:hypothetical protein [Actinomycetota bacterium]